MIKKQYCIWLLTGLMSAGLCFPVCAQEPEAAEMAAELQTEEWTEETPYFEEENQNEEDAPIGEEDTLQTETEERSEEAPEDISNEEAFDFIIMEDENGVMEQEDSSSGGTSETEAPKETETETSRSSDHKKSKASGSDKLDIEVEKEVVTNWGESLIAFQAYPVGDLSANESRVYQFLREELGLNKAAASGVLANIRCESGFSTVAVGDGGTSYGLCQWHAGRFTALVNWCNAAGYNYHLLEGQLQYMKYELSTGYGGVLSYLQSVPDTARGAYQAGYYWCMHFEMPNDIVNRSIYRGKMAMNNYFPADLDRLGWEEALIIDERSMEILDNLLLIEDPQLQLQAVTEFRVHMKLP